MFTKLSAPSLNKKPFNLNTTLVGTGLALIIAVLLIVISGTTLYFSPATEKWIPVIGLLIFFLSIFGGSFYTARKAGSKGLFHGLAVSVLFFIVSLIIGLIIGTQVMGLTLGKKAVMALLAGSLGGIWGVGTSRRN